MVKASEQSRGKLKRSGKSELKNSNFVPTPEVAALLEKVGPGTSMSKQAFINQCIAEHGPVLLGQVASKSKGPSLEVRLKYLEECLVQREYGELLEEWDTLTLKAHQDILKSTKKTTWYNEKSLQVVVSAAAKNKKTADTTPAQWQTLLRCHKEFLKLTKLK